MNTLIKKVLSYQQTKKDFLFDEIITELNQSIRIHTLKISKKYRDDLRQELLFEIYKAILKYKPYKKLISKNINVNQLDDLYLKIIKNKYFQKFKENNINICELPYTNIINLINEFYLFCNENQFKKFINVICERKTIDFYRKYKISEENRIISLNELINDEEELLCKIIDPTTKINDFKLDGNSLTSEELEFLELFYCDNRKLTEKEVAIKLGISQQAVSKRLIKIKNKLKKF